jgi:hypothetical protein
VKEHAMSTIDGTARERSLHPVHIGHLVMGLAFLGLVGVWAAVEYDVVPTDDVRWLLPLPWVFAGAAGLLAVLFAGRGRPVVPTGHQTTGHQTTGQDTTGQETQEATGQESTGHDLLDDDVEPHENEEIR